MDQRPKPKQKLGHVQSSCLRYLATRSNGRWYPGCGWMSGSLSQTDTILNSLAHRGLAERTAPHHYQITTAGLEWLSLPAGQR